MSVNASKYFQLTKMMMMKPPMILAPQEPAEQGRLVHAPQEPAEQGRLVHAQRGPAELVLEPRPALADLILILILVILIPTLILTLILEPEPEPERRELSQLTLPLGLISLAQTRGTHLTPLTISISLVHTEEGPGDGGRKVARGLARLDDDVLEPERGVRELGPGPRKLELVPAQPVLILIQARLSHRQGSAHADSFLTGAHVGVCCKQDFMSQYSHSQYS